MTDAAKLDYAIAFLRRKKTLGEITALADTIGAALLAGKTKVAITRSNFEGGGSEGEIEFECALAGQACESLLAQAASQGIVDPAVKLSTALRRISTTVLFGGGVIQ